MDNNMNDIVNQALNTPLEEVAPSFKKDSVTDAEVAEIVTILSKKFNLGPNQTFIAIMLLFLRGACNNNTPQSLSVTVAGKEISKRDLASAYTFVTNNGFLRRLAEKLAVHIGRYAEKEGLRGELAQRLDRQNRINNDPPLTPKELAWCSSFNQNLPNLDTLASARVQKLLAEDYEKRFQNQAKRKPTSPSSPSNPTSTKNNNRNVPRNAQGRRRRSTGSVSPQGDTQNNTETQKSQNN